jgi:hypothetical protein
MIITKRGNVVSSLLLAAILACAHSGNGPTASLPVPDQGALPPGTNSQSQSNGIIGNGESQSQSLLRGCPGGNGIRISVNTGTANDSSSHSGSDSSSLLNAVVNERRSIDTTIVFNIAQRNWTRTNLAAAITAGLADQNRGGYAICAGVSALIPSATLTIKGARGRVHFAATLQDLLNSIRSGPGGASPQLRRM